MHDEAFMATPAGHIPGITPIEMPAVSGETGEVPLMGPDAEADAPTGAEAAPTPIYIDSDEVAAATEESTAIGNL